MKIPGALYGRSYWISLHLHTDNDLYWRSTFILGTDFYISVGRAYGEDYEILE